MNPITVFFHLALAYTSFTGIDLADASAVDVEAVTDQVSKVTIDLNQLVGQAGTNSESSDASAKVLSYMINSDSPVNSVVEAYDAAIDAGDISLATVYATKLMGLIESVDDLVTDIYAAPDYYSRNIPKQLITGAASQLAKRDQVDNDATKVLDALLNIMGTNATVQSNQLDDGTTSLARRDECGNYNVDNSNVVAQSVFDLMRGQIDGNMWYPSAPRNFCRWYSNFYQNLRGCMSWSTDVGDMPGNALQSWAADMRNCIPFENPKSLKSRFAFGVSQGSTFVCGSGRPDGC